MRRLLELASALGRGITRKLPFIKKLGLELLQQNDRDHDSANVAIATGLR